MRKIDEIIKPYQGFIEAIVALFDPFVEVAVHDIQKGTLAAIYNPISKRKVGEKSPLKEMGLDTDKFPEVFAPYNKRNWDGKELKCTSITLRDPKGKPVALVCLNFDTTILAETKGILEAFLKVKAKAANPVEVFGGSCEEQVDVVMDQFLDERKMSVAALDRNDKKDLILLMHQKGIFHFKNSIPYVAKTLKLSRASIYNYIKEAGE